MRRFFICFTILFSLFLFSCNNFFHELIPPDGNIILSFKVANQLDTATIINNAVYAKVDNDADITSIVPIIEISEKASIIPITLEYIQSAFPGADLAKEAIGLYTTSDLAGYVWDLIERTPDFNIPAIDIPIDFSGPVNFFVISAQGNVRKYTVMVIQDTGEPKLLSFRFSKYENPELINDVLCYLDENSKTIIASVKYPAEMISSLSFSLIPSFEILGDSVTSDGNEGAIQFNKNFSSFIPQSKIITVTRGEKFVNYNLYITFTEDPDTIRSITDFRFTTGKNSDISVTAVGSIINNDNTGVINVQVFHTGAQPAGLIANFITPGVVTVSGITQTSGISSNNFSSPVTYRVVSKNGMFVRVYTVNVNFVNLSLYTLEITSFKFSQNFNNTLIQDAVGVIGGNSIMIDVTYGGNSAPSSLIPEFSAGGIVTVSNSVQVSGASEQDFSRNVKYTVTNPYTNEFKDYWVQTRMIRDTSSDASITSFGFYPEENPVLTEPLTGGITQDRITIYALSGTGIQEMLLTARFESVGQVSVNGYPQISGDSSCGRIYDAPVVYKVVSANGINTRNYTVIVRELKPVIYVKHDAAGNNDGMTWQDAFTDLKTACEGASLLPADIQKEIWIARGAYKQGITTDDYFTVSPNTSYIGGFGGFEDFKSQRNKELYPAVINGEGLIKGTKQYGEAFRGYNINSGNIIFEDLEFENFMSNFGNSPIYIEWNQNSSVIGMLQVTGCRFFNVNDSCIYAINGKFIIQDIFARNISRLINATDKVSDIASIIDNIAVMNQILNYGNHYTSLFILSSYNGDLSNIALQDIGNVFIINGVNNLRSDINLNNIKAANVTPNNNFMQITGNNQNIINISNLDIDNAVIIQNGFINLIYNENTIFNLDNISINNVKSYSNGSIIRIDNNNLPFLNSDYSCFINNLNINIIYENNIGTIRLISSYKNFKLTNSLFNYNNINLNSNSISGYNGFYLENVHFENYSASSSHLCYIEGNYPYIIKRQGSTYNGSSLADNSVFNTVNNLTQKTNSAVLTGE